MDKLCSCSLTLWRLMFWRLALGLGLFSFGSAWAVDPVVYGAANGHPAFLISGYLCVQSHDSGTPNMATCFNNTGGGWANSGVGGCPVVQCADGSCNGGGAGWIEEYMVRWSPKSPFPSGCEAMPTVDVCGPKTGQSAIPTGQVGYGESPMGTNPLLGVLCGPGYCEIKIEAATAIPIGDNKQGNYISQAKYTGNTLTASCPLVVIAPTPKDPTLPKPVDTVTPDANTADGVPQKGDDCPTGSAFGQVNGVNVCSPAGTKIAYVPDTTTQTNNGVETTSTVSKTSEVMADGSVKTTSTITTSSGGVGSVTTSTKTSGGPSGINGRDGKDGDSIDGIDLGPAPSAESELPGQFLPGPGPGQDGAGQAARTFAVQAKISGGATACISDRSVSAMGVTVTIPLSALCPWFEVMYNLVSAFAVFSALRILVMS